MKAIIHVTPKKNVLDPQGTAVGHALQSLGFSGIKDVRIGKFIEIQADGKDGEALRASLDKVCRDLLSNPVIEDYRYEIEEGDS